MARIKQKVNKDEPKKRKRRDMPRDVRDTPSVIDFCARKISGNQSVRRELKKKPTFKEESKNNLKASSKGRRRKKKLLFEQETNKSIKKDSIRAKCKNVKIKNTNISSGQIFSQNSTNGKSFSKECNLALYFGPKDRYKRTTKDFTDSIAEHEKEFELDAQEKILNNPPKFVIETQQILDKFLDLVEPLYEIYSAMYSTIIDSSNLYSFIKSELTRISIIYFNQL